MESENPLNKIFKESDGKITDEITDIKNISNFFQFLNNDDINSESKYQILEEFKIIIQNNRFISEFYSEYENKSIYIHLFDLYIKEDTNNELKSLISSLIEELCQNIQTGKEVYEYIFQKFAKIYRNEIEPNAENFYTHLQLLSNILCETDNIINPKNYFSCGGNCFFEVNFKERPIEIDYSFSIDISFKIANNYDNNDEEVNLIQINFSNDRKLNVDLKYPYNLIIKDIINGPIRKLKSKEYNNLIITITNIKNKPKIFLSLNGEPDSMEVEIKNLSINFDDKISHIKFFNNFFGEVSSIFMISQKEPGASNVLTPQFASELKNYKEGFWKKRLFNNFFIFLKDIPSIDPETKSAYIKPNKLEKKQETLFDNLIFMFTPINYYKSVPNIIEDALGNYQLKFEGNIKIHQYHNYQQKLLYVCEFSNFFPIAEMFLIYPETLNEQNFELFLKIISNMLNYRKQNLTKIKNYKFFNILSMFIEKYPQKIFTAKILDSFFELGKTLFISNSEKICSNYFKHILLNEKILSKYDNNLQIQFWNKLFLFYESDKAQVQTFLKINRLCLILRFYDRNKYEEMCCEYHLNMIKDQYKGSLKVMNPSMSEKLSNLKNLMDSVIDSQTINNAIDLFKLLTLDLSPCLVKFILNIFINAFKKKENEKWSENFVLELTKIKFGIIVINTFTHSLPDVRIELLKFMYQVHKRLISTGNTSKFTIFEKMLKTCLLPDKKFFIKKPGMNIANPPKKDADNKNDSKHNNNTNNINNNNNTNNNAPVIKGKSKFAALLAKFDNPKKPAENNVSSKPHEVPKKIDENIEKIAKTFENNNTKKNEDKKIKEKI